VRRPVEINLDASYPELGVRSFGRGTFHKPDLLGADLSWQKLFLVQQGDLVFSNIKAWEGAFAVAGPDDHGRVGSHRYLTCVPTQGLATADFIWFYLQTSEGLGKVQTASPGSADRNRTLGQGALEAITVPTPPISRQEWFDRLHAKARDARAIRAGTAKDVEALIPAMLHEIFNGKAAQALACRNPA
jgi:type I restriction enzyme S subunit